jgi:hypothetical protein
MTRLNTREWRMKNGYLPNFNDQELDRKRAERAAQQAENDRLAAQKKQQRGMALDFDGRAE